MPAGETKQQNPATGAVLPSVKNTPVEGIPEIIATSRRIQRGVWAKLSFKERAQCVLKTKRFLAANADRGADIIAKCNGKTQQDALATEILPCLMACDWYAKNAAHVLKRHRIPNGNILFANKANHMEYEPLGVVGIISPWNYPFSIPFGEVIMGLMAGNGIVLKVATPTTLVGCFIEECIAAGGFPQGLFAHIVVSGPTASAEMLKHGVNKIFFTGSVGVGKQLMAAAAATLTPLSLELGGNDPMVVLEDASIERAVNCALWAGFQNAGQSCGGIQRIYVQRAIYDPFLQLLAAKTKCLRHGPSLAPGDVDIGAITTKSQLDTVHSQVADSLAAGAKVYAQSRAVGNVSAGYFYPATVLINVTPEMRVVLEEVFGPIVSVIPFDTVDEGIAMANACTMALTSSVFSTNSKKARFVASKLESGVVTINDHLYTHGMSETPWGGWKESGLGRTHGYHGLREMCNAKCINEELVPNSWIPRNMWWFPFTEKTYAGMKAGVGFIAPTSIGGFLSNSVKLLKFATKTMFTPWTPDSEVQGPRTPHGSLIRNVATKLAMLIPVVGGVLFLKGI